MNITGEEIKEARERLHLTQQELATQVGVSMRTVGNWERGESVPRSRMGAIREVLRMDGPNDGRMELARLIREELETSRRGPSAITAGWSPSNTRSFYGWQEGSSVPLRRSRAMLEDALGWRRGVVTDIIDAPITKTFTLSEVRDWAKLPDPGTVKARDLSTDDLLMELTRRVGVLQARVDEMSGEDAGARNLEHERRDMYDVAANNTDPARMMEHLEDADD